jgi:hypothetical protein
MRMRIIGGQKNQSPTLCDTGNLEVRVSYPDANAVQFGIELGGRLQNRDGNPVSWGVVVDRLE